MTSAKFEYIWKFVSANDCSGAANVSDDVLCVICRRVLVDPCIAYCGCRFCLGCVTAYLGGERKFCPGNTDECKEELMGLAELGHPDYAIGRRISRLVVKCPREGCEFRAELRQMEEHDLACKKKTIDCPYGNIGCQEKRLTNEKIDEHLVEETESHARLLVECVATVQSEMAAARRMAEQQAGQISHLTGEVRALTDENRSIKEDSAALKSALEQIRAENAGLLATVDQSASERERARVHAEAQEMLHRFGEKCRQSEDRLGELERHAANEREQLRRDLDEMAIRVRAMGALVESSQWREFLWPVAGWNDSIEYTDYGASVRMFSDPFSWRDNKYKMCLSVWPERYDGCYKLSVWWYLMKGPFDNALVWPFRGVVTLSVIDQQTGLSHASESISSEECPHHQCWKRPTGDMNKGFASFELINLDTVFGEPALYQDDRIFIKCAVKLAR